VTTIIGSIVGPILLLLAGYFLRKRCGDGGDSEVSWPTFFEGRERSQ